MKKNGITVSLKSSNFSEKNVNIESKFPNLEKKEMHSYEKCSNLKEEGSDFMGNSNLNKETTNLNEKRTKLLAKGVNLSDKHANSIEIHTNSYTKNGFLPTFGKVEYSDKNAFQFYEKNQLLKANTNDLTKQIVNKIVTSSNNLIPVEEKEINPSEKFTNLKEENACFTRQDDLKEKATSDLNERQTKPLRKGTNLNDKNISSIKINTSLCKNRLRSAEKTNVNTLRKGNNIIMKTAQRNKRKSSLKKNNTTNLRVKIETTKNTRAANNRQISRCEKSLQNSQNKLLYSIDTSDGFHYSSTSLSDSWSKVFEAVQVARSKYNMKPLSRNPLKTFDEFQLLGLKCKSARYLAEQLAKAAKPSEPKSPFEFDNEASDSDEDDNNLDVSSGTRSMQYIRSNEPSDMFNWLSSKHRKPLWNRYINLKENVRKGTPFPNLHMSVKYKNVKFISKHSVGVYRSKIHQRGLFCHKIIEGGDMVIEYAGEVIRSILADIREKQYIAKGMGCYMFRIDENFVIDATMKGNAARFINHSCEPNCYSKVIEVSGHKRIVIYALRQILQGEELTYDYKFPFEEDKIPCTCGARRCRKYLN